MLPGEKISGLKRISKAVSLMEPTALQAFRTTSRLLGSVCVWDQRQKKKNKQNRNVKGDYVRQVMSKCVKISSDLNCCFTSNYLFTHQYTTTAVQFISPWSQQSTHHHSIRTTNPPSMIGSHRLHKSPTTRLFLHFKTPLD